ncbi:MAG: tetratricopeptide repeat protein [Thermodesulfobacteriota bacterium]
MTFRPAFCLMTFFSLCFAVSGLNAQSRPAAKTDSLSDALSSARVAFEHGGFEAAVRQYSVILKDHPTNSEALLGRGWAYEMLDRTDKATHDFTKVLQFDPDNYEAMEALAQLYERSAEHVGKALKLHERALAVDPRQEGREQLEVSIAMLRSRRRPLESYPVGLWHLGNHAAKANDLDRAERLYTRALSMDRGMFQARFSRALVRIQGGRADLALKDLDATLRLSPLFPRALLHRGTTLEELCRHDEAHQDFVQAVANHPKDPEGYYFLGKSLHRRGQVQEALDAYRKALTLKPKPDLRELVAHALAALPKTLTRKQAPPGPNMGLW